VKNRKLVTVLVLLMLLASVSCQSIQEATPKTHVANARAIYIAAVQAATTLGKAGLLDLKVAEQFESVRVRAAGLLAEADKAIANDTEFNFADLTSTMNSLQALLAIASGGLK